MTGRKLQHTLVGMASVFLRGAWPQEITYPTSLMLVIGPIWTKFGAQRGISQVHAVKTLFRIGYQPTRGLVEGSLLQNRLEAITLLL